MCCSEQLDVLRSDACAEGNATSRTGPEVGPHFANCEEDPSDDTTQYDPGKSVHVCS